MLTDDTAMLWEQLRRTGRILRAQRPDDWSYAHDEGVLEDLATLAAAQGLAVVDSDDGIWLSATPDSRYCLRPGDIMRGEPSREAKAMVSYISLIILSCLFESSRISDDLFVTLERVVSMMDAWADSVLSRDNIGDEPKKVAGDWKSKPIKDTGDEGLQPRPKVGTKTGVVLYAIRYLMAIDLLEAMPDYRWKASLRAHALWPYYAGIGAFSQQLKDRGIDVGVDDYA